MTNAFWAAAISGSQGDPRRLASVRGAVSDLNTVSGEEVAEASRRIFAPNRAWRAVVKSAQAPTPTTAELARPAARAHQGVWAQSYSDLAADPDIRFGVLPNLMRYAIRRNTAPAAQVSLRFRIGAGSLDENDDQQGLAHFLEHMAFKGSTHVAQDQMVPLLERMGLSYGPDVNAFTQLGQTFFRLDLPHSDSDPLGTSLGLMREIASELRLSQTAMDAERGVILSEERLDANPAQEAGRQARAFILDGQLAASREPMGQAGVVTRAPVSLIRSYYEAYYRPENTTLIIVGDIDVDAAEAKIRGLFSDWRGRGPAGPSPDLGAPKRRGEAVDMIARDGVPVKISLVWPRPFDDQADTFVAARRRLMEDIGESVLSKRLERLAERGDAPFVSTSVSHVDVARSATLIEVAALPAVDGFKSSLSSLAREMKGLTEFGINQDEYAEALKLKRHNLVAAINSSTTENSAVLADRYLDAVENGRVIMGPIQALAQFDAEIASVTRSDVNQAMKTAFGGDGPLIIVSSPPPVPADSGTTRALYDAETAHPQGPVEAEKVWPYRDFGPPGKVLWRRELADLGVTQVRFANGVRLNVKPTTFAKSHVQVTARIGQGLIRLSPNHYGQAWLAGSLAAGGTREMTADELQRV
ncbi:MAG TPA: pitrilysin family protein, partial [Caulobacteraceae bacterium]|nr:pitrilysin family protein [Caulobacteraceae bacterium]